MRYRIRAMLRDGGWRTVHVSADNVLEACGRALGEFHRRGIADSEIMMLRSLCSRE